MATAKADPKLIAKFDDMVSEDRVIELTGYSKKTLQRLRTSGRLRNWGTINGRKFQYSKTELVKLFGMDLN